MKLAAGRGPEGKPANVVALAGRATLNGFAFLQGATGPLAVAAAVLMGCIPPGFIYLLTGVAAPLTHRPAARGQR